MARARTSIDSIVRWDMRARTGWPVALLVLAGCATARVAPPPAPVRLGAEERGQASWYGEPFHGRRTSSGETFNMYQLTAAHRTLPMGTRVLVTHLGNGRSVEVRINDRGPFVGAASSTCPTRPLSGWARSALASFRCGCASSRCPTAPASRRGPTPSRRVSARPRGRTRRPCADSAAQELRVHGGRLRHRRAHGVAGPHERLAGPGHLAGADRVPEQRDDGAGERGGVGGRHPPAALAVADDLGGGPHRGAHHRRTHRDRKSVV